MTTPTLEQLAVQAKTNLDQIKGGVAGNKMLVFAEGAFHEVSGFVVKNYSKPNEVISSFALGKGKTLESISVTFAINPHTSTVKIVNIETLVLSSRSTSFADEITYVFMLEILKKLKVKVRRFQKGQKGGQPGKGFRLEAWPIDRQAPADNFDSVRNYLFTDTFIDIARNSNVTYK